jgi:hypothetical protein
MNWTRDHQWQLDNMSEPDDEDLTCEACGDLMDRDLLGDWVCVACAQKKDERNENRN